MEYYKLIYNSLLHLWDSTIQKIFMPYLYSIFFKQSKFNRVPFLNLDLPLKILVYRMKVQTSIYIFLCSSNSVFLISYLSTVPNIFTTLSHIASEIEYIVAFIWYFFLRLNLIAHKVEEYKKDFWILCA